MARLCACHWLIDDGDAALSSAFSSFKERLYIILRAERLEIVNLLADADKLYGYAKFILYRYYYTTFCRSVKLCENNSCNFGTFTEKFRLIDCILSSSRVKYQ